MTHRRWKKAAENAISEERISSERERLVAEVARGVLRNNGASAGAGECEEMQVALEVAVLPLLDDGLVRASLGLRYLDALEHGLRSGDYEDHVAMRAEAVWVEAYLEQRLNWRVAKRVSETSGYALDAHSGRASMVCHEVTARLLAELHGGVVAAA